MRRTAIGRYLLFFMALGLALGLSADGAETKVTEERIKVKQIVGTVEVRASGSGKWRAAKVGMSLRAGWDIRTFVESLAELEYESGTAIKMGENSVVTLTSQTKSSGDNATQTSMKVGTGQVWANVKKLTNTKSKFDFETPTAVASIRGTRLGLDVRDGRTSLDVYEGMVMLRNRESGQETPVGTRNRGVITAGQAGVIVQDFKDIPATSDSGSQAAIVDPFTGDTVAIPVAVDSTASDSAKAASDTTASDSTVSDSTTSDSTTSDSTAPDSTAPDSTAPDSTAPDTTVSDSTKVASDSTKAGADTTKVTPKSDTTKTAADTTRTATKPDTSRTAPPDTSRTVPKPDTTKTIIVPDTTKQPASLPPRDTVAAARPRTDTVPSAPVVQLKLEITTPAAKSVVTQTPVLVRGRTLPGASVSIGSKVATVGPDGSFSIMIDLEPGENNVAVSSRKGDQSKSLDISVSYRPPLVLTVSNLTDNMEVVSPDLSIDIEVSEGAQYSVNGRTGSNRITLVPGRNAITIVAWDPWQNRQERTFGVNYRKPVGFEIQVSSPRDGDTIRRTMISVAGSTVPGAKVTVNKAPVVVSAGGSFTYQIPIPNENQEYTIEVVGSYGDQEKSISRTVYYAQPLEPMQLIVASPVEGQAIKDRMLRISGKTGAGGTVRANSRLATVTPKGVFTIDIPLSERDIGDYVLDINALRGDEEMTKSVTVKIDGTSPLINTSMPKLVVSGLGQQAVRNGQLTVQIFDGTPGDEINLTVGNSGSTENFTLEPGGRETVNLNEGKNELSVKSRDKAGNVSNVITASLYFLPGPLNLDIVEPSQNPLIIDDLPPMPGKSEMPQIQFKVEIDDGIGNVPETIKYCRVTASNGQQILLRPDRSYAYAGELRLERGTSIYTIQAEDLAGNTVIKKVEVRIAR